ncbi:MAG: glycosyltransferase family 1 protein [Candidatus Methanomethylicaceae archaeon]
MRIGIVASLSGSGGGLYQHSINILHALDSWKREGCEDEFVLFFNGPLPPDVRLLMQQGWKVQPLPSSPRGYLVNLLKRVLGEGALLKALRRLRRKVRGFPDPEKVHFNSHLARRLRQYGIELMFYTAPTAMSFEAGIPYVTFIMDLQHRLQPHFPEVSAYGEWERREYLFRNAIRYATLLFVDSEASKEDILLFYGSYGASPDKIKVLPYLPACYLFNEVGEAEKRRVREKYRLPERYLFYPAQFWPHKNHAVIIQALEKLKEVRGLEIPVVFCGSHTGEIRERHFRLIMNMARYCGVADQVHYLGYVPDEDMSGLYANAVALVMPTFFGPANIPYLEAWAFGCPVLTSHIRGIREQVGDAGLLVNPLSVEALAENIYKLWTDESLRRELAERGARRLAQYTPEDYRRRLIAIMEEAKERVRAGDCPVYALTKKDEGL